MKSKLFLMLVAATLFVGMTASADTVTRLYQQNSGNHWFTTNSAKISSLTANGWTVEGTAFEAPSTGQPVSVVIRPDGYFHFTSNAKEISGLVKLGWKKGETVFYASQSGQAVYRVYNPNTGRHHFTANMDEINNLTGQGWNNEGIAYYVTSIPTGQEKPNVASNYFIDVSSHNANITVNDYLSLKKQGITGVTVKLTEGTYYTNPYAKDQIANARAANMRISVYHFSHYTNAEEAVAEADYFVSVAKELGLDGSTVMVGDIEDDKMIPNINDNMQTWADEMTRLGYGDIVYYTGARWVDTNKGPISVSRFGAKNFWLAHYPNGYTYMTQEEAAQAAYYNQYAAWQYTSSSEKLAHPLDESIDYTGRFTR